MILIVTSIVCASVGLLLLAMADYLAGPKPEEPKEHEMSLGDVKVVEQDGAIYVSLDTNVGYSGQANSIAYKEPPNYDAPCNNPNYNPGLQGPW